MAPPFLVEPSTLPKRQPKFDAAQETAFQILGQDPTNRSESHDIKKLTNVGRGEGQCRARPRPFFTPLRYLRVGHPGRSGGPIVKTAASQSAASFARLLDLPPLRCYRYALGIGANTRHLFTLVESTLLRPIAVKHPDRLRLLTWREQFGGWVPANLGYLSPTFGTIYEQRETPDGGLMHTDFTPRMYEAFRSTLTATFFGNLSSPLRNSAASRR